MACLSIKNIMWQRFSEKARKVVFYAQEYAQSYGHGNVSAEHLLLGLLREDDSTACKALAEAGLSRGALRTEVEARMVKRKANPNADMKLTSQAKRVIDRAYDSARSLNNNFIGTEHLLLALVREGRGIQGLVFKRLEVSFAMVETAVIAIQAREGAKVVPGPRSTDMKGHTTRAQSILSYAREAARAIGEGHISTEHFLLAGIRDPETSAAIILDRLGVTPEALRAEIDRRTATYRGHTWNAHQLPRAHRVLELAKEEAKVDDAELIGTSHYLLALIREGHGVAAKALRRLGVAEANVREARDALRSDAIADAGGLDS